MKGETLERGPLTEPDTGPLLISMLLLRPRPDIALEKSWASVC